MGDLFQSKVDTNMPIVSTQTHTNLMFCLHISDLTLILEGRRGAMGKQSDSLSVSLEFEPHQRPSLFP